MAEYKVSNQYLSEEEYRRHCHGNWIFIMFGVGALIAGLFVNNIMPSELYPDSVRTRKSACQDTGDRFS